MWGESRTVRVTARPVTTHDVLNNKLSSKNFNGVSNSDKLKNTAEPSFGGSYYTSTGAAEI